MISLDNHDVNLNSSVNRIETKIMQSQPTPSQLDTLHESSIKPGQLPWKFD